MTATTIQKKLRILMLAADCNPQWHSLPALIANYYLTLHQYADITLVTQIRNKSYLNACAPQRSDIIYLDTEKFERPIFRIAEYLTRDINKSMTSKTAFRYPSNLYFECCAWKYFAEDIRAEKFDIIHRVSPMSPTIPSLIQHCSTNIPFVIGPVLGGLKWPKQYIEEMRRESEWLNYFRKLHSFLPFYHSTYKKASAILAGYQHTINDLPQCCRRNVIEFSEGGIHTKDYPERCFEKKQQRTVLFVGRMVPFKQPEILIQCFSKSHLLKNHRLVMIGDGPELERLKELVKKNNIEDCVTFTGSINSNEVKQWMYRADIFGFPSIREQGGGVITMASMASMPSVVVDYGGPSTRVRDNSGIRVKLNSATKLAEDFQSALEYLIDKPEIIERMGKCARAFTQQFYDWEWKAKKTLEIYDWVLKRRTRKPNFWDTEIKKLKEPLIKPLEQE